MTEDQDNGLEILEKYLLKILSCLWIWKLIVDVLLISLELSLKRSLKRWRSLLLKLFWLFCLNLVPEKTEGLEVDKIVWCFSTQSLLFTTGSLSIIELLRKYVYFLPVNKWKGISHYINYKLLSCQIIEMINKYRSTNSRFFSFSNKSFVTKNKWSNNANIHVYIKNIKIYYDKIVDYIFIWIGSYFSILRVLNSLKSKFRSFVVS